MANEFSITGIGSSTSDSGNALITAGGGSGTLASRFIYGGNSGYFFISDLVPGMEYVATFYSVAWEDGIRAQTFAFGNDRQTFNQDHFNNNNGIRVSYRYVAPASGAILLTQTPLLPASSLHLYGFANCEANPLATPVVGLQPRSQVSTPGSTATFSVTAGGARPLFFQWYNNGTLLTDQTNRFLTISNLTLADVGPYYATVSNANSIVTSDGATLTFGQIANPGFEADVFQTWPGYASGNKPISGWTGNNSGRIGLNPMPFYPGPFANNGTVPEGTQVGFLQSTEINWISTILDALTPGQKYTLTFRAAGRAGQVPLIRAAVDGQQVAEFRVGPVDGTNAYRHIAFDFTPAMASPVLYLTNNATGNHTMLMDDFRIAPSTTKWSYTAWTSDADSGVDGAKNYSHACNFGGFGLALDTVINGVPFLGVPGVNPAVNGQFGTVGLTGAFGADGNNVYTAGGGSAALARSFVYYGGTIPADIAQTITLSNLVPGVEYEATIYGVAFDVKYIARAATFAVGEDRMTISEDAFDDNNGIRVSYRYVADPSGTFTLTYWPTERSSSFHTYGFSNAELTSTNPPIAYRPPQDRTVTGGGTVVLDALFGGQGPLFFQWQKDGMDLTDQTNLLLTLAAVDTSFTGNYTLIASNATGVATSAVARLEVGLPTTNPSFEAETYPYPGYIGANAPITGWTASIPASMGINPGADGQSPFANSGNIPDGARVAFIQADGGVLSQVINGMVVGRTYYVKFFENARSGSPSPALAVTLGGETIVAAHVVNPGPYVRVVSGPYLATAESAELAFVKTAGPAGGDSTALIDSVVVLELPPSPPNFLVQPQGVYVKEGENVALNALAQGTLPMTYQWQRNETDVEGATGASLELPAILMSQAGSYTVIAENSLGRSTSSVAVVRVGVAFTELFNTGVDSAGTLTTAGSADSHYQLISSADPSWPGPAALVMGDLWPVEAGVYMLNGPDSKWISPRMNSSEGNLVGDYIYRTAFLLDTQDPATAELRGKWAMDNYGFDIRLNGVSLGISNNTGFASFGSFTITSGFVAGSNTIDFVINNAAAPGPTAMRVELYGVAQPLAPKAPEIVSQPQSQFAQELSDVTFSVLATGSPSLTYQWYFEGLDLLNETNRILRRPHVSQLDQSGSYWVVIANSEGSIESDPALLTINAAPATGNDFIACAADQPVTVPISKFLYNDEDFDGDTFSLVSVSGTTANGGLATLAADSITYTPPAGFTGTDQFTYTVQDARGGRATATVTVTVGVTSFISVSTPPTLLPNGHFQVGYQGIPGYLYVVERATKVDGPWEVLTTVYADGSGFFQVDDPNDPPETVRFYRVTYP